MLPCSLRLGTTKLKMKSGSRAYSRHVEQSAISLERFNKAVAANVFTKTVLAN
jgi:hypothetical protein